MDARQRKSKAANTRDLLAAFREYETQAALLRGAYGSFMAADGMLHWLAVAAKELREGKDRLMSHVAASANMDQSSIYRFETHSGSPRDLDKVIAAYADDLEMHAIDIWRRALDLWDAAEAAKATDGSPPPGGPAARAVDESVARIEEAAGSRRKPKPGQSGTPRAAGQRNGA